MAESGTAKARTLYEREFRVSTAAELRVPPQRQ